MDLETNYNGQITSNVAFVTLKRNPYEHDCHSTRRTGKVKCATKYWVCEKVKDLVLENPKVTAKELQRRIKDEYKVLVH